LLNSKSGVIKIDPWLEPFKADLQARFSKAQDWIKTINDTEGGLEKFSRVWPLRTTNICAS
jgi:1,4-alpha-glucan branching enzyme